MTQFTQPDVAIGQPGVVWLISGNPLKDKPVPAQVNDVSAGRSIDCTIFNWNSAFNMCKPGVRHYTDPWLKDHQEHLYRFGAWAYFDELTPSNKPVQTHKHGINLNGTNQPESTKTDDELEAEVIAVHEEGGLNAVEIATRVGHGMSHQKVNAILRKAGRLQAGQSVSVG